MISPDLAETVRRLRGCRCSNDGATLVDYAALMSILDALEGLERDNASLRQELAMIEAGYSPKPTAPQETAP